MAAVGTTFNIFGFDAIWTEHQLPNAEQIPYVIWHGRGVIKGKLYNTEIIRNLKPCDV